MSPKEYCELCIEYEKSVLKIDINQLNKEEFKEDKGQHNLNASTNEKLMNQPENMQISKDPRYEIKLKNKSQSSKIDIKEEVKENAKFLCENCSASKDKSEFSIFCNGSHIICNNCRATNIYKCIRCNRGYKEKEKILINKDPFLFLCDFCRNNKTIALRFARCLCHNICNKCSHNTNSCPICKSLYACKKCGNKLEYLSNEVNKNRAENKELCSNCAINIMVKFV